MGDLFFAISQKRNEDVLELINNGADVDAYHYGKTVLNEAIKMCSKGVVETIIQKGANINQRDGNGKTPLMIALGCNKKGITNKLLSLPVDVNIQDNQGKTAIIFAIYNSEDRYVDKLLAMGANVNVQDSDGNTPLMTATIYCHTGVLKTLLSHSDIDLNIKNKELKTALDRARGRVSEKQMAIIESIWLEKSVNNSSLCTENQALTF